jgi:hypothetical protein
MGSQWYRDDEDLPWPLVWRELVHLIGECAGAMARGMWRLLRREP